MAKLSISQAWDDARPIIARDGRLMFIIALATVVVPSALMMVVMPEEANLLVATEEVSAGDPNGWTGLVSILSGLINIIGSIAISYLALTRGASVGDGLRRGLQRLLPTIGTFLLALVIVFGLTLLLIVVVAGVSVAALQNPERLAAEQLSPLAALAILALIPFIIWVTVRFLLVTPVIAAEDGGPIHILTRSWSLTKGHFWRLFGFLVLFAIAVVIFYMTVSLIVGLAVTLLFGEPEPMTVAALVAGLLSGLAGALTTIIYSTITARIYLQLAGRPADPDAEELRAAI